MSILKEQMGEAFHTALRKGCDSKWSTAMWQAFKFCPDKVYSDFIKHLEDNVPEDDSITAEWIKEYCENWDKYGEKHFYETRKQKWNDDQYGWAVLISSILEIMPDHDAECIVGFINYCTEER